MDLLEKPFYKTIDADANFKRLLTEENPDLVFVKDEQFRFIYANQALLNLYPPDKRSQVVGHTTVENFEPEAVEVFLAEDRKAFERGRSEIVEEIVDHSGLRRIFMTKKIRFKSEHGEPLLFGIATDITALAARERELIQSNANMENFAALAAHDLRAPLSTFVGCVSFLRQDKNCAFSETGQKLLDMMQRSATNLASQINGLLGTFKARHRQSIELVETDLNLLFAEVQFNLQTALKDAGAVLRSNRLPVMSVDPNLFRHLVMNLVENSIKYRTKAKPVIIFKHNLENDTHLFTVEDNGIGISPDNEARVFQIYEQADGQQAGGVGLGLSLCRNIAELHNGRIWVDQSFKPGCRICIAIPQAPA